MMRMMGMPHVVIDTDDSVVIDYGEEFGALSPARHRGHFDQINDPLLSDLIEMDLPPLVDIENDLELATAAREKALEHGAAARVVERFSRDILGLKIARGRRRRLDRATSGRPEGCWCAGTGGKGARTIYIGDAPETYFAETCSCPDGEAAQARKEETIARLDDYTERVIGPQRWQALCLTTSTSGASVIPERYHDARVSTWVAAQRERGASVDEIRSVVTPLSEWVDRPERWLILYGPPGHGKTGLSCALLRTLAGSTGSLFFRNMDDLFSAFRSAYQDGEESVASLSDAVIRPRYVVLDDFGLRRSDMTPFIEGRQFHILNQRYANNRVTILSTNLAGPDAIARFIKDGEAGPQLWSRIADVATFVEVKARNLRSGLQ